MGMDPVTLMAGTSLIGGLMGSDAASSASDAQVGASREATASQRAMFDTQMGLQAPFRSAGVNALQRLSGLMGIGGNGGAGQPADISGIAARIRSAFPNWDGTGKVSDDQLVADFERQAGGIAQSGVDASGGALNPGQASTMQSILGDLQSARGSATGTNPSDYGSLTKPFSMEDFQLDPGIQFQMQQGQQALQNSQAAKNGVLSGGALKDLMSFNQGMAGTGYQSAFDRYMGGKQFTLGSLMGLTNLGQSAASNTANNGSQIASGIAGTITGAGNASAAGSIGSANALSGGLSGVGNAYFLSSLLGKNGSIPGVPTPGAGTVGDFPNINTAFA